MIDVQCARCGVVVAKYPSSLRKGRTGLFFCSADCKKRAHIGGTQPRPIEDRFWEQVAKSDGCWLWTGTTGTRGYGQIKRRLAFNHKIVVAAHRVSWELHFGPIPPGLFVCHKCDVRACVRPDHLFLGTGSDNVQDMLRKGRWARITHGMAKITAAQVTEIRDLVANGGARREVAAQYGISHNQISAIVTRKSWRQVA